MDLKKLIREALEDKDCCKAKKPTKAPILNENLAPREILSEGLKYHIDNKKPLTEHVYRAGSTNYFHLWAEARALYSRGILDFSGDDLAILTETNLGEFGYITEIEIGDKVKASKEYGGLSGEVVDIRGSFIVVKTKEGNQSYHESNLKVLNKEAKKVPLDFIMEEENVYQPILEDIKIYGKIYESVNIENSYSIDDIESDDVSNSFVFTDKHDIKRKLSYFKGGGINLLWLNPSTNEWTTEKIPSKYEDEKVMNTFGKILIKTILPKYKSFNFKALNSARYRLFRALIYNNLDTSKYEMDFNDETMEIDVYSKKQLEEAKKAKKKTPELNKPKRGGSKKFYVYVKAPGGKIKKVSFGDTSGLSAKINNPEARRAFSKRHDCPNKTDKTKASYWSCRLPRYAKLLGLKSNFSGFW